MRLKFLMVFIVFVSFLKGFSNDELFKKGVDLYKNQNYPEALIYFDSLRKLGFVSAELFYNLGNCYYKQNELGKAILHYEKAKKINPKDEDIIHNINFCNRLVRDKAGATHESPLNRLIFGTFSSNNYSILALIFSLIASFFVLMNLFTLINPKIRITLIVLSIICSIAFLSLAYFTNNYQSKEKYAIIISPKVTIYVEPKENSKTSFILHEGSKIEILEVLDNWKKIKFANGKVGWAQASNVEII